MTDENKQQNTPDYTKAEEIIREIGAPLCMSCYARENWLKEEVLKRLCNSPAALEALGLCKKSERDTYKAQLLACMADCAEKIKKLEKKYAKK